MSEAKKDTAPKIPQGATCLICGKELTKKDAVHHVKQARRVVFGHRRCYEEECRLGKQ